jgi:hypothetical protein
MKVTINTATGKITYTAEVGDYVRGDEWPQGKIEALLPCPDWDRAEFRYSTLFACNIEVTGSTMRKVPGNGAYGLRCRITVPGDGEPDTAFSGWIMTGWERWRRGAGRREGMTMSEHICQGGACGLTPCAERAAHREVAPRGARGRAMSELASESPAPAGAELRKGGEMITWDVPRAHWLNREPCSCEVPTWKGCRVALGGDDLGFCTQCGSFLRRPDAEGV